MLVAVVLNFLPPPRGRARVAPGPAPHHKHMTYQLRAASAQGPPATPPSGRTYRLRGVPVSPVRKPLTPFVAPRTTAARKAQQVVQRPRSARAQVAGGKGGGAKVLATYSLKVATEAALPSFLGSISLRCQPGAVDLARVVAGLCGFAIDHDASAMVGRITSASLSNGELRAVAQVVDLPRSHTYLRELRAGLRSGISPGFLIHTVERSERKGAGEWDFDVTRWEPYEISSTPVPRNAEAKIVGEFGMNSTQYQAPALVTTSDPDALATQCARVAVRDGRGSPAQQAKLSAFLSTYDALVAQGQHRDAAAQAAAASAGIR